MHWDRFDIVEAHYMFCVLWHAGKSSPEYARLCRISQYFKPSPLLRTPDDLEENAREIYDALARKADPCGRFACHMTGESDV